MKAKVNKLEENSKNKNIREIYKGINEFKKGYQPRAYVIKKQSLVADSYNLNKLVDEETRKEYQIDVANRICRHLKCR